MLLTFYGVLSSALVFRFSFIRWRNFWKFWSLFFHSHRIYYLRQLFRWFHSYLYSEMSHTWQRRSITSVRRIHMYEKRFPSNRFWLDIIRARKRRDPPQNTPTTAQCVCVHRTNRSTGAGYDANNELTGTGTGPGQRVVGRGIVLFPCFGSSEFFINQNRFACRW